MPTENNLRRRAAQRGLRLIRYSHCSRWRWQYGPYALADADGALVAYGLELDAVAAELA